jgi:hypothetical protein
MWKGDFNEPMSYNRWIYGYGNPIMRSDPTGMRPSDPEDAANRRLRGHCKGLFGKDREYCEKLIRGLNPRNDMSLAEVYAYDGVGDPCIMKDKRFTIPGNNAGTKYEDYGLWFHYLLNERSKYRGHDPLSISTVIAYALSAEADVQSLYSTIMPYMARAMVGKGRMLGSMYSAIGSRQVVMDDLNKFIFFDDLTSPRIKNRNWNGQGKNLRTGEYEDAVFAEVVLREYFMYGRNYQPKEDLRMKVSEALQFNFGTNTNNIPMDWGNTNQYLYDNYRTFWDALNKPLESGLQEKIEREEIYYRSRPQKEFGQFFILTLNQQDHWCSKKSCVSAVREP